MGLGFLPGCSIREMMFKSFESTFVYQHAAMQLASDVATSRQERSRLAEQLLTLTLCTWAFLVFSRHLQVHHMFGVLHQA